MAVAMGRVKTKPGGGRPSEQRDSDEMAAEPSLIARDAETVDGGEDWMTFRRATMKYPG